jgi:hypothetical protein
MRKKRETGPFKGIKIVAFIIIMVVVIGVLSKDKLMIAIGEKYFGSFGQNIHPDR